jgi:CheY-like chemotaxis protein
MTRASTAAAIGARARRVLVIEDEILIAMVLEDMLDLLGHVAVGSAATLAEASAAVDAGGFDLVIADVNLGAESIYPLADRLLAAGVQLVLATGSHRDTLPARFAAVPVLEKPYTLAAIEAMFERIA